MFEIEAAAESDVESWYCHALNEQRTVTVEDIRAEGTNANPTKNLSKQFSPESVTMTRN